MRVIIKSFMSIFFFSISIVTSPECLGSNLGALLLTAEQRVQELGGSTSGNSIIETASCRNDFTTPHNGLTRCADTTDEKQLALWERRVRALRKMLLGFDQARKWFNQFYIQTRHSIDNMLNYADFHYDFYKNSTVNKRSRIFSIFFWHFQRFYSYLFFSFFALKDPRIFRCRWRSMW